MTKRRNHTGDDMEMAKRGILKRETESLLIAAQNNARTNYIV